MTDPLMTPIPTSTSTHHQRRRRPIPTPRRLFASSSPKPFPQHVENLLTVKSQFEFGPGAAPRVVFDSESLLSSAASTTALMRPKKSVYRRVMNFFGKRHDEEDGEAELGAQVYRRRDSVGSMFRRRLSTVSLINKAGRRQQVGASRSSFDFEAFRKTPSPTSNASVMNLSRSRYDVVRGVNGIELNKSDVGTQTNESFGAVWPTGIKSESEYQLPVDAIDANRNYSLRYFGSRVATNVQAYRERCKKIQSSNI